MEHFYSFSTGGITLEEVSSDMLSRVIRPPQDTEKTMPSFTSSAPTACYLAIF